MLRRDVGEADDHGQEYPVLSGVAVKGGQGLASPLLFGAMIGWSALVRAIGGRKKEPSADVATSSPQKFLGLSLGRMAKTRI